MKKLFVENNFSEREFANKIPLFDNIKDPFFAKGSTTIFTLSILSVKLISGFWVLIQDEELQLNSAIDKPNKTNEMNFIISPVLLLELFHFP